MESGEHQPDPGIGRFWIKYAEFLRQFRVPAKAVPWYRRHIEAFIADHPDVRLLSHSAESVERWLSKVGRDPNLTDWQFRQKVDALRILMGHFLRLPWCSAAEVASFLEHLPLERKVSGATQAQVLNALEFLFSRVLERPLGDIGPYKRPKKPKRLPTVFKPSGDQFAFEATYRSQLAPHSPDVRHWTACHAARPVAYARSRF